MADAPTVDDEVDTRPPAQFVFEQGFFAAIAETLVRTGTPSITITEDMLERAWARTQDMTDDPEADRLRIATAVAAPDLLAAHLAWEAAEELRNDCIECDNEGPWEQCEPCSERFGIAIDKRHAALAKAGIGEFEPKPLA